MVPPKSTHPAEAPESVVRVLIADQANERLDALQTLVESLGHEVVARSTDVSRVAALTTETLPDLAVVTLGASSASGLGATAQADRLSRAPKRASTLYDVVGTTGNGGSRQ